MISAASRSQSARVRADDSRWVLVVIAGTRLILGTEQVDRVFATPLFAGLPGSHPWVRGIALVDGTAIPVYDVSAVPDWRGGTEPGHAPLIVTLRRGEYVNALAVDSADVIVGVSEAVAPSVAPLPDDCIVNWLETSAGPCAVVALAGLFRRLRIED